MSTPTEELLKLSIIYRRLINTIEEVAGATFTAEQKHQMVELVNESVGVALNHYVARCRKCDRTIELICNECDEN